MTICRNFFPCRINRPIFYPGKYNGKNVPCRKEILEKCLYSQYPCVDADPLSALSVARLGCQQPLFHRLPASAAPAGDSHNIVLCGLLFPCGQIPAQGQDPAFHRHQPDPDTVPPYSGENDRFPFEGRWRNQGFSCPSLWAQASRTRTFPFRFRGFSHVSVRLGRRG